jgi:hypothetical protein
MKTSFLSSLMPSFKKCQQHLVMPPLIMKKDKANWNPSDLKGIGKGL